MMDLTQIETANFVFETVMRVRNTEVGIGQHLTTESMAALISEARARFLYSKGIKEINANYHGLITTQLNIAFISRARAREELLFEVGAQNLSDNGGELVFKVTRMFDASVVAYGVMGFVAYDYRQNQEIALTAEVRDLLDVKPFDLGSI